MFAICPEISALIEFAIFSPLFFFGNDLSTTVVKLERVLYSNHQFINFGRMAVLLLNVIIKINKLVPQDIICLERNITLSTASSQNEKCTRVNQCQYASGPLEETTKTL